MADNTRIDKNLGKFNDQLEDAIDPLTNVVDQIKLFDKVFLKFTTNFIDATKDLNLKSFGKKIVSLVDKLGGSSKELGSAYTKLKKINEKLANLNFPTGPIGSPTNAKPATGPKQQNYDTAISSLVNKMASVRGPKSANMNQAFDQLTILDAELKKVVPDINIVNASFDSLFNTLQSSKNKGALKALEDYFDSLSKDPAMSAKLAAAAKIAVPPPANPPVPPPINPPGNPPPPPPPNPPGNPPPPPPPPPQNQSWLTKLINSINSSMKPNKVSIAFENLARRTDIVNRRLGRFQNKIAETGDDLKNRLAGAIAKLQMSGSANTAKNPMNAAKLQLATVAAASLIDSSINKLTGAFDDLVDKFQEMNLQALRTGATQGQIRAEGADVEGVPLADMMEELIQFRDSGIKNLNQSTKNLIGTMRMTGQNTQTLIKFLGSNANEMLLSRSASEKFAQVVADSAEKYGQSAENVINGLNSMSNVIKRSEAIGSTQIKEGIAILQAQAGPENAQAINDAIKFALDPANLGAAIGMGLGDSISKLQTASTGQGAAMAIKEIIAKGGAAVTTRTQDVGTGADAQMRLLASLETIGGEQALSLKQANVALQNLTTTMQPMHKMADTWQAVWNEFKKPLETMASLFTEMLQLLTELLAPILKVIAPIVGFIAGVIVFILKIYVLLGTLRKIFTVISWVWRGISILVSLLNPIGLAIAAIVALAAGIWWLVGTTKKIEKKIPEPKMDDNRQRFDNLLLRSLNSSIQAISENQRYSDASLSLLAEVAGHGKSTNENLDNIIRTKSFKPSEAR